MPTFYLGIDVAKAKLDCALRYPDGKVRTKIVPNTSQGYTELLGWLSYKQALDVHVCLEATGVYWEDIAQFLATQGLTVSVVTRSKSRPTPPLA